MNWIFITITDGTASSKFNAQDSSFLIGDEIAFDGISGYVSNRKWTRHNELTITVTPLPAK